MPISAGLREDIAVYRGFIGQQYKSKAFKSIIVTQLQHKKHLIVQHNTHHHRIIKDNPQNKLYLIS